MIAAADHFTARLGRIVLAARGLPASLATAIFAFVVPGANFVRDLVHDTDQHAHSVSRAALTCSCIRGAMGAAIGGVHLEHGPVAVLFIFRQRHLKSTARHRGEPLR